MQHYRSGSPFGTMVSIILRCVLGVGGVSQAAAMNAFMSLVATFLLDLSRWSPFIKTPVHEIVRSLFSVSVTLSQVVHG